MAVTTIPLRPVAAQSVSVLLAGQPVTIELRQIGGRQYLSARWGSIPLCDTVLLVNRSAILRAGHTGFIGDLAVIDTQGDDAPEYSGWGSRWQLVFNDAV